MKSEKIPINELIAEHKRLVAVLNSGDKMKIKREAKLQEQELKGYMMEKKK